MSFPVSPAVNVREIDLSASAAESLSSLGAFAGKFKWGPVGEVALISNEDDLVNRFGRPVNSTAADFFTAASFLAYTNGMNLVRIGTDGEVKNAAFPSATVSVRNDDDYVPTAAELSTVQFIAKYVGDYGNSLAVVSCTSALQFEASIGTAGATVPAATLAFNFGGATPVRSKVISYTGTAEADAYFNAGIFGDNLVVDGVKYKVISIDTAANTITLDRIYTGSGTPTQVLRRWAFADNVGGVSPGLNEVHVLVVDEDGVFTKSPGAVIETFASMSTVAGTRSDDGRSIFYKDVIGNQSQFIRVGAIAPASTLTTKVSVNSLVGGDDADALIGLDEYIAGYDLFKNAETVDAPIIIGGQAITGTKGSAANAVLANYLIQNLAEVRKDGIVFLSPTQASVVNNKNNEVADIIAERGLLPSTSYAVLDSGWKYMYDKYNDTFRWVPLNGDHAGIYARVDRERETWYSAAGTTRGLVKNIVKLAWSPDQVQRDSLYVKDINPVTNIPVAGPTFFGDKTLLGKNSAFSRINVRRLFIILEKTVATAARDLLFEFNDEFTQRRFVSIVEPFLRDVRGRRGITDFRVIADSSVNTPQVVQNNRFVGQIFIKPNYSINFIRLDFVAVNASASFDEVAGSV